MASSNCSTTTLSCCPDKVFVQDQICIPWSGIGGAAPVNILLYQNNFNQNIAGTGFIKYEIGSITAPIVINFLNSTGGIINTESIPLGSSLAFTIKRFDTIVAVIPVGATGELFQGEFCITARYSV